MAGEEERRSRVGIGVPGSAPGVTPGQSAEDRRRAAAGTPIHGTVEGPGALTGQGGWFTRRRRRC